MKTGKVTSHNDDCVTIAFRVSREDYEQIKMLVDISGMVKQDYLLSRSLCKEFNVYPNIRIKKYMQQYLIDIYNELVNNYSDIEATTSRLEILLDILEQM